ncbi:MAG: alpha/beta hydrolase domain-containing protein, partial [Vicinamibacterales bacterium]|nr:alpha/beta hydrolase domain-containing protein [Vicinamibacterales bacterium]
VGGTIERDALSYDIFSAVGRAARLGEGRILGDLDADRVIATGHSQSAGRLATYLNNVHPRDAVYEAVMVHGGGGELRTDQPVKIFKLMAETDMPRRVASRQPDTDTFRQWEVAGSSHVDIAFELERERVFALADRRPLGSAEPRAPGCDLPEFSRVPFRYVMHAAFEHMVRWVDDGTAPPTAPPLDTAEAGPPAVFSRDARGNVLGGIRLATHAVPTATNTGLNSGSNRLCRLYGSHEPFDNDTLASLYPTHDAYVDQVKQAVTANLAAGYILAPDARTTIRDAERSDVGRPYGAITGDHLKTNVRELTAMSRRYRDAGHQFWGRIIGTEADTENAEWMAERLRTAGVPDVRIQTFDLPAQWMPQSWSVTATSTNGSLTLASAQPAYSSSPTPSGGLDLHVVYVGLGTAADFAGRDVAGAAVLISSMPMRGALRHTATLNGAIQRADELGAAAILVSLALPGNLTTQFYPTRTEAPTFSLGGEDGTALREAIELGAVRVRIDLDVEMVEGLQTANVVGELPGTTDETIIIVSHRDGWFEGANDNASGVSTALVLAEYFASRPQSERRRTIRFVGSPGHHNSGRVGIQWMVDNAESVFENAALLLNLEHTAGMQTLRYGNSLEWTNQTAPFMWYVGGSPALQQIVVEAYESFGVPLLLKEADRPIGEIGPIYEQAPSFQLIDSGEYFHSDQETAATVPADGIEAVTRAFAKVIDEANRLNRAELQRVTP